VVTLDQANGNALAVLLGDAAQPSDQRNRALAIGLHGDAQTVPAVELRIDERLTEQLRRDVEAVLLFCVNGEAEAFRARSPGQRQEPRRQLGAKPSFFPRFKTRMQRR